MPQPPMTQQPLPAPGVAQAAPPQAMPPVVSQEPPPVIMAKPMVTVPDRQRPAYPANPNYDPRQAYDSRQAYDPRPAYDPRQQPYGQQQADADQDYARPRERRPLERFVDAIKPSTIFNHMREFGDRIEAAGNEILPTIRQ